MSAPPRKRKSAAGASRRRRRDPRDEGEAAPEAPPGTKPRALTPGLAMMEEAVQFTNSAVLDPTGGLSGTILPTGMQVGANALAEQAGAMMIEDMRSFLQGAEMILLPAIARALDQTLRDEPAGAAALSQIETVMASLSSFSQAIIATAATTRGALD
jgi:hypothetical protein